LGGGLRAAAARLIYGAGGRGVWAGAAGPKEAVGLAAVPATVPALWPCCARAVSWARPAAHALHGPPCRADTGTVAAVPCGPWAVPKGRAACRATGPWAAWPYILVIYFVNCVKIYTDVFVCSDL